VFSTALLPVSFREPAWRLKAMLAFLQNFDTERVVLLHVSTGPISAATQSRIEAIRDQVVEDLRAELAGEATNTAAPDGTADPEAASKVVAGMTIDVRVRSGSPAFEISLTAREEGADFIYFPWKRKNWIQRTLVGSTTKDVIRLSNLPIFVFKQRRARATDDAFRILYPTNFKDTDRYVVAYLQYRGLAADELVLLNVHDRAPDPTAESRQESWCRENLSRLTGEVEENFREVEPVAMTGSPRRVIPRVARRNGTDLVILGKSDQESALSAMLGSVAEEVANSAPCSVFIVSRAYLPEGAY
jgi:nucleotide-binding universal stress UspA family protein